MKKCLRNTNILNDLPSFDNFSIFVVEYESISQQNFRSDGLSQDNLVGRSLTSRTKTKKKSNKTFLKND